MNPSYEKDGESGKLARRHGVGAMELFGPTLHERCRDLPQRAMQGEAPVDLLGGRPERFRQGEPLTIQS